MRIFENREQLVGDDLDVGQREEVVRIAREAIVNAVRHGGADHVAVVLDRTGDHVHLRISDNGRGVAQAKLAVIGGHGLQMMRSRAAVLGGCLTTRQQTEGGLEVEVTFPLKPAARPPFTAPADRSARRDGDSRVGRTAGRQGGQDHLRGCIL